MIAIISDLHSNFEAASAVFEDIERQNIEKVYCLGDVIGYGADPRKVLRLIMDRCQLTLLGNHEFGLLQEPEGFNEKARIALEWTKGVLNSPEFPREENHRFWNFLGDLPQIFREGETLYVHGSPRVPLTEYMLPRDARDQEKMGAVFEHQDRSVCFVGHSHIPGVYTQACEFFTPDSVGGRYRIPKNGKVLLNIGSVGQPRDGDPRLSYVTYDGDTVFFHRLHYERENASEKIRAVPQLPEYLAQRLLVGR